MTDWMDTAARSAEQDEQLRKRRAGWEDEAEGGYDYRPRHQAIFQVPTVNMLGGEIWQDYCREALPFGMPDADAERLAEDMRATLARNTGQRVRLKLQYW